MTWIQVLIRLAVLCAGMHRFKKSIILSFFPPIYPCFKHVSVAMSFKRIIFSIVFIQLLPNSSHKIQYIINISDIYLLFQDN